MVQYYSRSRTRQKLINFSDKIFQPIGFVLILIPIITVIPFILWTQLHKALRSWLL